MKPASPPLRVPVASPQVGEQEIEAVSDVIRSGKYISGKRVEEFERLWAGYVGVDHVVAVNSGTAALHAALMALDVGPGDEVIVPALTFFSTVSAVMHQNAVPVFADISVSNFSIDPADVDKRITARTRAVIAVHYFGHVTEMNDLKAVCARRGVPIVEDAAQAHGSTYHGARVGGLSELGAFSFFATKHMTTGEGGAVTTNNAEWADKMRKFRGHGMSDRDTHEFLGYNYRMTEMAAAIGKIQIQRLDGLNDARIRNSERLIEKIRDIDWLETPKVPAHVGHTYFWCHILVDEECLGFDTQTLVVKLAAKGIETRNRYTEPLYKQPVLNANLPKMLALSGGANLPDYGSMYLPCVERVAGRVIGLPNRPDMTEEEIDKVATVLRSIRD